MCVCVSVGLWLYRTFDKFSRFDDALSNSVQSNTYDSFIVTTNQNYKYKHIFLSSSRPTFKTHSNRITCYITLIVAYWHRVSVINAVHISCHLPRKFHSFVLFVLLKWLNIPFKVWSSYSHSMYEEHIRNHIFYIKIILHFMGCVYHKNGPNTFCQRISIPYSTNKHLHWIGSVVIL